MYGETKLFTGTSNRALAQRIADKLHMKLEETAILPEAERCFSAEDWRVVDAAFSENFDPLSGHYPPTEDYEKLFSLIVTQAPSPVGLG